MTIIRTGDLFLWAMARDGEIRASSYAGDLKGDADEASRLARHDRLRHRHGFAFDPARALRADQLTLGSSSTGQQPWGVVHALAAHDINRGRLKRREGDALCNARLRPIEWAFADPEHPITCPKCSEILHRIR